SSGERAAIGEFLERGGRLVATGHYGAELIETWRSETSPLHDAKPTTYTARSPSPLTMNAEEIVLEPRASWIEPAGAPVALFADAAGPGVVVETLGEGRIIWWAGEGPLTNAGLPEKGNLELFLGSIGPPEDLLVLWDEYYHGQRGSLWSYLAATPVPWGFLQAGALMLAAVLTWGRRAGPIRPALDESRHSPLEFVETIGDLYERAHAASGAVEIAYQRVRSALARRLGMPPTAEGDALRTRALQRLSRADTGVAETLLESQRALSETTINEWKALQLVQALHAHGRRLTGATPTTRQETR
ncbi:MAG TPA: hypothetical protein VFG76_02160, partial [Candidatus Polarisedimenticolia bacterium]|nr:hypothetical protein [Candidatus Polarisedimenticolia bacterium]